MKLKQALALARQRRWTDLKAELRALTPEAAYEMIKLLAYALGSVLNQLFDLSEV